MLVTDALEMAAKVEAGKGFYFTDKNLQKGIDRLWATADVRKYLAEVTLLNDELNSRHN